MTKKISIIISALFILSITAVLMSPSAGLAGWDFWYGYKDEVAKYAPDNPEAMHDSLVEGYIEGLDNELWDHDTIEDSEYGQVTIHKWGAWNGYTLLTSFGGLCAVPKIWFGDSCPTAGSIPPGFPPIPVPSNTSPILSPTGEDTGLCEIPVAECPAPWMSVGGILIDMDGNFIKGWPIPGIPVEMLPTGNIRGGYFWPPSPGGAYMAHFVEMNWKNLNPLSPFWKWSGPAGKPGGARVHHDHQSRDYHVYYTPAGDSAYPPPGNPRTLVLSHHDPNDDDYLGEGAACPDTSGISKFPLFEDAIYEIDDVTGEVLFAWYPCQHFEKMGFEQTAKDGIMNYTAPNPAEPDVWGVLGILWPGDEECSIANPPAECNIGTDYQHINSASYLGPNIWYSKFRDERFHPDNIIWDSRTNNIIAIIARHPGSYKGETWDEGDIVWKVGPHYKEGYKENRLGQIIGVHMAHMIPKGLPGAGNIIAFDNGGHAGYGPLLPGLPGYYPNAFRSYSRIIEFNPITLRKVWEYKCPVDRNRWKIKERKFYSRLISSVQRLPNGNTLICEGQTGRIFEVTRWKKRIVWEYISGFNNGAGLGPSIGDAAVYRAYRVPARWVNNGMNGP